MFVIANIQSFTSQIFGVFGRLGETSIFSPLGFDVQTKFWSQNPNNQVLLSQSFKTLSESEKSDTSSSNVNSVHRFFKRTLFN